MTKETSEQLLLKQPLGNPMDLQDAVNGQLLFEGEDEMNGQEHAFAGVSIPRLTTAELTELMVELLRQTNMNRAPFNATPRGSTRGSIPPASGSRRSDPGSRPPNAMPSALGLPNTRPAGPNFGVSGYGSSVNMRQQSFGTVTPAFGSHQNKENIMNSVGGTARMRDNLAQMQKRMNVGAEPSRDRQPLARMNNAGNVRGNGGGGFGLKSGVAGGVNLRGQCLCSATTCVFRLTCIALRQPRTLCSKGDMLCDGFICGGTASARTHVVDSMTR